VERRRVAVEPAEIEDVDGLDVVVQRPVVAAIGPKVSEARRQLDLLRDFDLGQPLIGEAQRLVVDEAVEIALLL
jgi:hypothetical protein